MPSNITVDGCDYTLRLDDAGERWQVVTLDGSIIADFVSSDIAQAIEYAYYCSDGDIEDGVNTGIYYAEWSPERIATWLVSTHPES